ncbi:adrenocorticotropic hormone receptor [Lingula anatina]|uniref:Adrenocorticotropic hormone receptor n=1 Tax=Lingula anatina TaxID=7574 RepID=A0A1S3H5V1_LINAN|nr:adrenocorticotropic hormone receptor [Lingula anatina]|eukprot:XP_013381500.1 adrenocorticotropic hormone receptor [Lingula anatina]
MPLQEKPGSNLSVLLLNSSVEHDADVSSDFAFNCSYDNVSGNCTNIDPVTQNSLLHIMMSILFYAFCAAGIVTNSLSLIAIYHTSRPFKPKRIFITNLAAVDLATVLFILLTDMIDQSHICSNMSTTILISVYEVSGLTVLTLTIDMFIAVCVPLHYSLSMTKVRACIIVAIIWGFIIGKDLLFITVGGSLYGSETLCEGATPAFPSPLVYFNAVLCALILLLSLILYITIFLGIRKHQSMLHNVETRVQIKMNLKTTVTLLLLYSSLLVSWGPWIVAVVLISFGYGSPPVNKLLMAGLFLMLFNVLSDSIVFGIRMPDIRKGLRKAFKMKSRSARSYASCPTMNGSLRVSTSI